MRKHIDYYYKVYDMNSENLMDKVIREKFNDYGYNFDSSSRTVIDYDKISSRTNYQKCLTKLKNKSK